MNLALAVILSEIRVERARQEAKWGIQHHPHGVNRTYDDSAAATIRELCQRAAADGTLTWRHIMEEEWAEAKATSTSTELRDELIQVAAVAVAWIEDIDRSPP